MKKKTTPPTPAYTKRGKSKVSYVYLALDVYKRMEKELREYERIKKKEGIRWVQVSSEKKKKAS
jgi:hypothetical protein